MASETITVRENSRVVLTRQLKQIRNQSLLGTVQNISGYVLKMIVKQSLDLADTRAYFDLSGAVLVAASGTYTLTLSPEHTCLAPGTYPGEIRWWSPPDAPTTACVDALAGAGAGNVNNGLHSYKITFVSPFGESLGSPVSDGVTVVNLATNGKVALSSIPLGPSDTTARKIFRTIAGDTGDHKLVATISDNSTTTYEDNVADGSLGAALAASATATNIPPRDAVAIDYTIERMVDQP